MSDRNQGRSTPARAVEAQVRIDASPDDVWEAIATAEGLVRWFPIQARVRPGEGGEVWFSWGGDVMEGTARILAWEPPRRLVTQFGWMTDEYVIEGDKGLTTLRVTSSGFEEGADWDRMYDSVTSGWSFELYGLKHALERHRGLRREVVRARVSVDLSAADAFERLVPSAGSLPLAGGRVEIPLAGGMRLTGHVVSGFAPREIGVVLDQLNNAYFRVQIEAPCGGEAASPAMQATLWASTFGLEERDRDRLATALRQTLRDRLGEAPSA